MSHLVVFDTNVFVSHFLTPGKASAVNAAVSRIFERKAIPVYSDVTMLEYIDVLNRTRFGFSEYKICSFLKLIRSQWATREPRPHVRTIHRHQR